MLHLTMPAWGPRAPNYKFTLSYNLTTNFNAQENTKKLSNRKDDCAMRPIHECPENFRESLIMPTATFPEIFNGPFPDSC